MRILVFSDTHGYTEPCIKTINNIIGVDMIIHAGDHDADAQKLEKRFPDIPIKYVRGNCDISTSPSELLIDADDKKIFVTHGHMYNVKYDHNYHTIKEKGLSIGADAVIFGHTHIPYCENFGNILLLNPGSVKSEQKFGVIEIENGKIKAAICDC